MHKEEIELFLKRARNFLDGAKERFQKEDWDLTCFMAEQSVQILLKAIILEKGGEIPKTHSIRKLFGILYQLTKDEVFKYDRKALVFLESAYLNSRYFSFVYEKEDAKEALKIAEEVKDLVESVRYNDKNQ
ncbi:MAG: HEPN domain-containing protein [Promethearchaeota archaeon]|nr:MAG: HEPN domain-containing protein [Candidatus Lokiarchaeota archaeon]